MFEGYIRPSHMNKAFTFMTGHHDNLPGLVNCLDSHVGTDVKVVSGASVRFIHF